MWVFGYGSLLWNPGFDPVETHVATLQGFARSFCMLSIHHRGSEAHPGLVLALEEIPSSACQGMAFRVAPDDQESVLAALRARELVSSAYLERWVPLTLPDGRSVEALVYVVDTEHAQYCNYPLEKQAEMIATARGDRGPNWEYLFRTVTHLDGLGIGDAELNRLAHDVRDRLGPDWDERRYRAS